MENNKGYKIHVGELSDIDKGKRRAHQITIVVDPIELTSEENARCFELAARELGLPVSRIFGTSKGDDDSDSQEFFNVMRGDLK